ncbi:metal ABC transporter ATP-binding protein [Desulfofalx alkaliphila]|uniref:metal ABC transporter ATP-binding protein n=1 Tax=Desulfofalx alkaliphila TaxID=105483 RepID=UPI0004E238A0|nr:metal ABC transporter ATP-binding protein [Desulfofalx alkaliphila]
MEKGNCIIEIKDMYFNYSCHPVLENINLSVKQGDSIGITGPNGAGKSTLLKLILGSLKPSAGFVKIFGVDACKYKSKHQVGYVPQKATSFNQGFPTTVLETVVSGRAGKRGLFKFLNGADYEYAEKTMKQLGIYHLRHRMLSEISGGQQQLVFIARALVSHPRLLVLDEPTVGIDKQFQDKIVNLLKELNNSQGITLLIVSHEPNIISPVINRQVCLDKKICHCSCHSSTFGSIDCKRKITIRQAIDVG